MSHADTLKSDERPLNGRYRLDHFRNSWRHCHLTSNYFATLGQKQPQNLSAYYLCSTVINELLELVYNQCDDVTRFELDLKVHDNQFSVSLITPNDTHLGDLFSEFQSRLDQQSADQAYLSELQQETTHPVLGLLQLAADHQVRFELDTALHPVLIARFAGAV